MLYWYTPRYQVIYLAILFLKKSIQNVPTINLPNFTDKCNNNVIIIRVSRTNSAKMAPYNHAYVCTVHTHRLNNNIHIPTFCTATNYYFWRCKVDRYIRFRICAHKIIMLFSLIFFVLMLATYLIESNYRNKIIIIPYVVHCVVVNIDSGNQKDQNP